MMESEKKIFEMMNKKAAMSKYWMPLVWATNIINRARKEALITSDHVVQTLLVELSDIRKRLGALIGYDTVCVPLVYTQVSILSWYWIIICASYLLTMRTFHKSSGVKHTLPHNYMFDTLMTNINKLNQITRTNWNWSIRCIKIIRSKDKAITQISISKLEWNSV